MDFSKFAILNTSGFKFENLEFFKGEGDTFVLWFVNREMPLVIRGKDAEQFETQLAAWITERSLNNQQTGK